ncbi:MAG TPA: TonB family protein [Pyrinomonadaceae bacterium]|jgi:TonB family protein
MTNLSLALCALLLLSRVAAAQLTLTSAGSSLVLQEKSGGQQTAEPDEAARLNEQVVQLYKAGKLDEALSLAKRVLQLREKASGQETQLVVEALINLAELYLAKKSYKEALPLYERALKSNERQAGPGDAGNALLLDKTAFLRFMNRDFSGAENDYKRSLAINEKISGAESEQSAQSAFRLAEFYRFTNSYRKAEPLYQRAVSQMEKSAGASSPKLVPVLESYACHLSRMNRTDESIAAWKRAGQIRASLINERLKAKGSQSADGEQFSILEPVSKPLPVYPEAARHARLIGVVTVRVTIDGAGRVIRACGSGADPILLEAAEQAALRARFRPLVLEGIPTERASVIVYNFSVR